VGDVQPEGAEGAGEDSAAWVDEDVERLTDLLLDVLGPAVAWWRVEAARRLGLDAPSLACLDLVRAHRRVPASLVVERTGLTRSAVSKMLRRLRAAGHVELIGGGERNSPVEVGLEPHAERDAELVRLRREVRDRVRWTVTGRVPEPERAAALRVWRELASCLHSAATRSADDAAEARRLAVRRRERERGCGAA
jgi:DNA-binding MarR family transcriptional regulator